MTIAILYLFAIASAELVTALVNPTLGIAFHVILLFALIIHAYFATRHPGHRSRHVALPGVKRSPVQMPYDGYEKSSRVRDAPGDVQLAPKLYLALSLAPLIRIFSLLMPLAEFSQIYWYLIISLPLLAGIFAIVITFKLRPREIGLSMGAIPLQVVVALAGIGLGFVDYLILEPELLVEALGWQQLIAPALVLLVATGFVEELVFRGVMQRASVQALGAWGWVYIAVLYSVLQIGHLSAIHCWFALVVALLFGFIVKKTGSLLGVSLSHGIINIALYLVFPFLIQQGL